MVIRKTYKHVRMAESCRAGAFPLASRFFSFLPSFLLDPFKLTDPIPHTHSCSRFLSLSLVSPWASFFLVWVVLGREILGLLALVLGLGFFPSQ